MQSWNLREIDTPDGTRSPVVLRSDAAARAVLISLQPGQALGDHQVKERALVSVVDGSVRVEAGDCSGLDSPRPNTMYVAACTALSITRTVS